MAGVLVFHLGFGWSRGGFLGVSAFFTLSGYFICTLLLEEHAATGRIDLRRFWSRRLRRLLPAALLALLFVLVFGATMATFDQAASLRGDVFAALAYVANWRFLAAGQGYSDLFAAPSPVLHFWSLAIEEQCYVAFPLVVAGALALGRGRRVVLGVTLAVALVASIVAGHFAYAPGENIARFYFGTDTRVAELLIGALLAVVLAVRGSPKTVGRRSSWVLAVCGAVALVGIVWSWHGVDLHDPALYRGGFVVHATAVALVIVAAQTRGPAASVLGVAPLRWLGRISYGAYLYHWPIFLWLTPGRTGLATPLLSLLRLGVTFAAAEVSARVLEDPIRSRRVLKRAAPRLAIPAMAALALGVVLVPAAGRGPTIDFTTIAAPALPGSTDEDRVDPEVAAASANPAGNPLLTTTGSPSSPDAAALPVDDPTPATAVLATESPVATRLVDDTPGGDLVVAPRRIRPGETPRIYFAGDSVALVEGTELSRWGSTHGLQVWPAGWFACPVARGGTYRYAGVPKEVEPKCNTWATQRARDVGDIKPHIAVISYGVFDVLDRQRPGDAAWQHLGEPAYDAFVRGEIAALTELLIAERARVVWLVQPDIEIGVTDDGSRPAVSFPESDPRRMARFNELVRDVVGSHPGSSMIDLKAHLQGWPGGELDPKLRPDGVHPSPEGSRDIADWLGRQLLDIAAAG